MKMVMWSITKPGLLFKDIHAQQKGADCDETFCPVVSIESLRVMIAIAVHNGLKLDQVDKMYGLVSQSTLTRYWRNLKCKAPSQ